MYINLVKIEDTAENIQTFWFKPEVVMDYIAGQFIEMYLPHKNADIRGQKHWFTLSSSPTEELVSITTKRAQDKVSSFKQRLFSLEPGAKVKISEPMGDFVLPKDSSRPLLFVAGGIGITPMRSMVKWLLDNDEKRQIQMLYGVRTEQELAFLDLFRDYGLQPNIVVSSPAPSGSYREGHITSTEIKSLADSLVDPLVYISGPEPMIENLETELLQNKFPAANLVLDFFPGYKPV